MFYKFVNFCIVFDQCCEKRSPRLFCGVFEGDGTLYFPVFNESCLSVLLEAALLLSFLVDNQCHELCVVQPLKVSHVSLH